MSLNWLFEIGTIDDPSYRVSLYDEVYDDHTYNGVVDRGSFKGAPKNRIKAESGTFPKSTISFDIVDNDDDPYVEMLAGSAVNAQNASFSGLSSSVVSISSWVNSTGLTEESGVRVLEHEWAAQDPAGWLFYVKLVSGVPKVSFALYPTAGAVYVSSTEAGWADGQWNHVAATYDGTYVKVYVNGILGKTTDVGSIALDTVGAVKMFTTTNSGDFKQKQTRVYSTVLDQDDVTALYNYPTTDIFPQNCVELLEGSGVNLSRAVFNSLPSDVISISTWVSTSELASTMTIVGHEWASQEPAGWMLYCGDDGDPYVAFKLYHTSGQKGVTYRPGTWSDNNWYHIAAIYDGTYMKLYIDSVEVATPDIGSFALDTVGEVFMSTNAASNNLKQAETRIYNIALSQDEVTELYNNPRRDLTVSKVNLIAHWNYDTLTGSTIIDKSGLGNDLTINSDTNWSSEGCIAHYDFSNGSGSTITDLSASGNDLTIASDVIWSPYTVANIESQPVIVRLIEDGVEIESWRFKVLPGQASKAYNTVSIKCVDFLTTILDGEYPSTDLISEAFPEALWVGAEGDNKFSNIEASACVPIVLGASAYIPLQSIADSGNVYYVMGELDGNTFDVNRMTSPHALDGQAEYTTQYTYTQSTMSGIQVFRPYIGGEPEFWVKGGDRVPPYIQYTDSAYSAIDNPVDIIKLIMKEWGAVDGDFDASWTTAATTVGTTRGITFSRGYYKHYKRKDVLMNLIRVADVNIDTHGATMSIAVNSKASQDTLTSSDVVKPNLEGIGTFKHSKVVSGTNDSGYVQFNKTNVPDDKVIKVLVTSSSTKTDPVKDTLSLIGIRDSQDAQAIAQLHYQKKLNKSSEVGFEADPEHIVRTPGEVITVTDDLYGGTTIGLIDTMFVNADSTVKFKLNVYSVALQDFEDLSPSVVTDGVDSATGGLTGSLDNATVLGGKLIVDAKINVDILNITTATIQDLAITVGKIGAGAVTESKIGTGAVTEGKIGNLAITAAKIANSTITATQIENLTITVGKIGAGAVTEDKLGWESVVASKIKPEAVTTSKIAAWAVETANIDPGAVTESKIGYLAVTVHKIGNLAITAAKIANGTITANQIDDLTITAAKIANGTITATQINDLAITAAKIANLTITATQIDNLTITAGKIANNTITANQIQTTTGTFEFTGTSEIVLSGGADLKLRTTVDNFGIIQFQHPSYSYRGFDMQMYSNGTYFLLKPSSGNTASSIQLGNGETQNIYTRATNLSEIKIQNAAGSSYNAYTFSASAFYGIYSGYGRPNSGTSTYYWAGVYCDTLYYINSDEYPW